MFTAEQWIEAMNDRDFIADMERDERVREAAPDMLAALHEIESFLDNRADVDDGIPNEAMRLLVELRAALRKAEGK